MINAVREPGILATNNNGNCMRSLLEKVEWAMSREEFTATQFLNSTYRSKKSKVAAYAAINVLVERKWLECVEVPQFGRTGRGRMYKYRPAKSLRMMMLMFKSMRRRGK